MRLKCNIYGSIFSHTTNGNLGYSTHAKTSKYIEWVYDGSGDISFYIDGGAAQAFNHDDKKKKYLWMLETKDLIPIYDDVKNNIEKYLDVFEMIFSSSKELVDLDERVKYCPGFTTWIKKPAIYEKSKLISMIASNKTMISGHLKRLEWVNKLKDHVDAFGMSVNRYIHEKEEGLNDYMFSVAIENDIYEGWFTEKILDCFATGTIPIYLGAPDIGKYFDINGIILLNEDFDISRDINETVYYNKMPYIVNNLEILLNEYPIGEDYIYLNYLK